MKLYNTLTKTVEEFVPIKAGEVKMYCCGPTVYSYAHLGNFRSYLFEDLLRRVLEYNGYTVHQIMNITDVGHLTSDEDFGEDKVEKEALKVDMTVWDLVETITSRFLEDMKILNIELPEKLPRATEHIKDQIKFIEKLEKKGFCYRISDGIYFDVSKFTNYGKLSGQNLKDKKAGARVEINDEKKHPFDFALWKFSPEGQHRQMEWKSPWSEKGFPGWHIECSAMSLKYFGEHFDIHCGGVDHLTIHHENEIAQNEAMVGRKTVNYWIHGEYMMIDGKRMGKSNRNAYLVQDLKNRAIDPLAFRYFNLGTHYRIQLNFTWKGIEAAATALKRLKIQIATIIKKIKSSGEIDRDYQKRFNKAVSNDLNSAKGLSLLWEVLKSDMNDADKLVTVLDFDKVLGLKLDKIEDDKIDIDDVAKQLLAMRENARREKDFAESDRLRDELKKRGYLVKDTADGQILERG